MHDVSTAHPGATYHVVNVLAGQERGIALVRLETDDPRPVLTDLDDLNDVIGPVLLWKRNDEAQLQEQTKGGFGTDWVEIHGSV